MKGFLCAVLLGISTVIFAGTPQQDDKGRQPRIIQDGIRFCESTYPYRDGILVANFGTDQLNPLNTEGKGYILYCKDGKSEMLLPADGNLSAPKGMFIRDNYLFVCDVNKIVVYNLSDKKQKPRIIRMPEGDLFVNDLAASGNDLFVSVTNTDKIYRIDISDLSRIGTPVEWLDIPGPNGLLLKDGIMYVASYPADGKTQDKHTVYRIADLKKPKAEKFIAVPGQYDGIVFSTDGKALYVTNWTPAQISRIDLQTKKMTTVPVSLEKSLAGPADISVKDGSIYIPDLPNSRVVIVKE